MLMASPMQISRNRWIFGGIGDLIEHYTMIEAIWNEVRRYIIYYCQYCFYQMPKKECHNKDIIINALA